MDQTSSRDQLELDALRRRYAKRIAGDERYQLSNASALLSLQERHRTSIRLLSSAGLSHFESLRLVEVGCGDGGNLLDFLRWGFAPEHLTGIELLVDRVQQARSRLPDSLRVLLGDAAVAQIADQSADVVFAATVFSSILDGAVQQKLADSIWRWVRPGGAILWYDFTFDNPRNPDVCAVPVSRIRALFPKGRFTVRRVTLAPPISRRVCKLHPAAYYFFNVAPFLRTHALCLIVKD